MPVDTKQTSIQNWKNELEDVKIKKHVGTKVLI